MTSTSTPGSILIEVFSGLRERERERERESRIATESDCVCVYYTEYFRGYEKD